jgi:HSP20 family protein
VKRRIYSGWELQRLQQEIEEVVAACSMAGQDVSAPWAPPVDILERDDRFVVQLDLPGVPAADIHVSLCDRVLHIRGRKAGHRHHGEQLRYHTLERHTGRFELEIWLPGPVNREGSTARLSQGVLEVAMPRIADRRNTVFEIQVADEEP